MTRRYNQSVLQLKIQSFWMRIDEQQKVVLCREARRLQAATQQQQQQLI